MIQKIPENNDMHNNKEFLDILQKNPYTVLYERIQKGESMPKIIENLQSRLIAEAKRQIAEDGYTAMTIRSVAAGCGVGVGTVYNYFSSKDELIASFMLEDWQKCVAAIHAVSTYSETPRPVLLCIYDQLLTYARHYQNLFRDAAEISSFPAAIMKYHGILRKQIAQPLRKFCADDFTAEFAAEALLTWTMGGKEFEELYALISKVLRD